MTTILRIATAALVVALGTALYLLLPTPEAEEVTEVDTPPDTAPPGEELAEASTAPLGWGCESVTLEAVTAAFADLSVTAGPAPCSFSGDVELALTSSPTGFDLLLYEPPLDVDAFELVAELPGRAAFASDGEASVLVLADGDATLLLQATTLVRSPDEVRAALVEIARAPAG